MQSLVKETKAHVIVFFLRLRFRSLCSSSLSRCGSSSELAWVSKELLEHLSLLEGDVGHSGDSQEVLHAIDHAVGHRGDGRVGHGQGQSSNICNSCHELCLQVIVSDVQDLWVKHRARVIHLLHNKPVGEGGDLQHVEQGGLGHTDLVPGSDKMDITGDLNSTLGNLGWNLQSLEERSLLGPHTGVLGWHHDIQWGKSSGLSRSSHLVGQQHVPDLDQ